MIILFSMYFKLLPRTIYSNKKSTFESGTYTLPKDDLKGDSPPFIIHADSEEYTHVKGKNHETEDVHRMIFSYIHASWRGWQIQAQDLGMFCKTESIRVLCLKHQKWKYATREVFYYFLHFAKNLPEDMGKGGLPVIIFFDGHTSRWNLPALCFLMENNIHLFFLPLHTSV